MNIVWNPNPLMTQIFLNDHEKEILKLKIRIFEMEMALYDVEFYLNTPPFKDSSIGIENAQRVCSVDYWDPPDGSPEGTLSKADERVNYLFDQCIIDLERHSHAGDCTCVPCSCMKCFAEDLIGVSTIKDFSKYDNNEISKWFADKQSTLENLDKLIEHLASKHDKMLIANKLTAYRNIHW